MACRKAKADFEICEAAQADGIRPSRNFFDGNASMGNLSSKAGIGYTYDTAHPHAVKSLSNGYSYVYDANGNMTDRNLGALTFDLAYDAENRLVTVTGNGVAPTPTSPPPATATNTSAPSSTPTKTNTPTATPTTPPTFQNGTFVYDGDGKRVKSIINNAIITYFVGAC